MGRIRRDVGLLESSLKLEGREDIKLPKMYAGSLMNSTFDPSNAIRKSNVTFSGPSKIERVFKKLRFLNTLSIIKYYSKSNTITF